MSSEDDFSSNNGLEEELQQDLLANKQTNQQDNNADDEKQKQILLFILIIILLLTFVTTFGYILYRKIQRVRLQIRVLRQQQLQQEKENNQNSADKKPLSPRQQKAWHIRQIMLTDECDKSDYNSCSHIMTQGNDRQNMNISIGK